MVTRRDILYNIWLGGESVIRNVAYYIEHHSVEYIDFTLFPAYNITQILHY